MWRELTLKIILELAVSCAALLLKVETHSDVTKIRSTEFNELLFSQMLFLTWTVRLPWCWRVDRTETGPACAVCGRQSTFKGNIKKHIESQHITDHPGISCEICGVTAPTRNALRKHKSDKHTIWTYLFWYWSFGITLFYFLPFMENAGVVRSVEKIRGRFSLNKLWNALTTTHSIPVTRLTSFLFLRRC